MLHVLLSIGVGALAIASMLAVVVAGAWAICTPRGMLAAFGLLLLALSWALGDMFLAIHQPSPPSPPQANQEITHA